MLLFLSLLHTPTHTRRDSEQTAKFQAFKDAAKCISLSFSSLPSICFYTLINTSNGLVIILQYHCIIITLTQ